jgi:hypothetical protein
LYALETRIHEEEELRMKEFNIMKDHTKKLLYTLDMKKTLPNDPTREGSLPTLGG